MLKSYPIQKTLSIAIPCVLGWTFTYLAIDYYKMYAYGLFVWLPFVMGGISTIILGYDRLHPRSVVRNNAYLTLGLFCIGLLLFAWEGIICLLMAAPIGLICTYLGFLLGRVISNSILKKNTTGLLILFAISVPGLMAFEDRVGTHETLRTVTTTIEINGEPENVWNNVIAFPELKPPTEFVFKTGIAYPINATITGKGVGAIRNCNFSTGSFVEPITVWNEPGLLQFSVLEQPVPMKEISPYNIHPNHLEGYWISKRGQFKLIKLANGHTLLEGTTWYVNKIQPGFYWERWSDYIVHKIHTRVLEHIKEQVEKK